MTGADDGDAATGDPVAVRVLSYNVRSLRDDGAAVAAVIRACRPDIACIQEAPRLLRWRSRCADLARTADLMVVTGGRPAAGNLIACSLRARVLEATDVLLPKRRGLHQRGIALAVLEIAGARLAVAGSHLSLSAAEGVAQAGVVRDRLHDLPAPHAVLCADVNDHPAGPTWAVLTRSLRDGHVTAPVGGTLTFPAASPDRRIDGIFVSPGVEVRGCGVPEDLPDLPATALATGSDHRPVVADLVVPRSDGRSC